MQITINIKDKDITNALEQERVKQTIETLTKMGYKITKV